MGWRPGWAGGATPKQWASNNRVSGSSNLVSEEKALKETARPWHLVLIHSRWLLCFVANFAFRWFETSPMTLDLKPHPCWFETARPWHLVLIHLFITLWAVRSLCSLRVVTTESRWTLCTRSKEKQFCIFNLCKLSLLVALFSETMPRGDTIGMHMDHGPCHVTLKDNICFQIILASLFVSARNGLKDTAKLYGDTLI